MATRLFDSGWIFADLQFAHGHALILKALQASSHLLLIPRRFEN
jgi:hypothetical protein